LAAGLGTLKANLKSLAKPNPLTFRCANEYELVKTLQDFHKTAWL